MKYTFPELVMRRNIVCFFGIIAATAAGSASFQATDQQSTTFHAGTRLVAIDVVVRGKGGPVAGLTKDDFTLLDEGRPRKIDVFRAGPAENEAPAAPLPPGAVSNRIDSSGEPLPGATVVLIDQLNTTFDLKGYAAKHALEFVRALGLGDRVAIYTLGKDLHVLQEFTDDPGKLVSAMMHSDMGRELTHPADLPDDASKAEKAFAGLEAQINADYHNRITIEALRQIVRHLSGMPGRRNLVWLKENPTVPPPVMGMLLQNNIALYPVLVRTVLLGVDILGLQKAGRDLAAVTGGTSFDDALDLHLALETAQQDARSVYTLGYYPSEEELDGKFHRIAVKVTGEKSAHLEVKYRPGYAATREPIVSVTQPSSSFLRNGAGRAYEDLLTDPLDATAIGVAAASLPDPAKPGAWRLQVNIDLHDVHLEHAGNLSTGVLELAVPMAGGVRVRTLQIGMTDKQLASALSEGFIVTLPDVEASGHDVRLIVRDPATGLAGSVRVPLAVNQ